MLRRHFRFRPRKARRAIAALGKLINFDKALVLDMYIEGVATARAADSGTSGVSSGDCGETASQSNLSSM
jgi:hypothetical protein